MAINRQVPSDMSEQSVLNRLDVIKDVFTSRWLNKKNNLHHPIKKLWSRKDYLATVELYTIGNALKLLLESGEDEWVKDYAKRVKKAKPADQAGVSYEAVVASYFIENHFVKMPPDGQPGYDIVVKEKDLTFLISCKKLLSSDSSRMVEVEGEKLKEKFIAFLNEKRITGVQLFILGSEEGVVPNSDWWIATVDKMFQTGRDFVQEKGFAFFLRELEETDLSQSKVSYQLNMFIPKKAAEQKRFENLFGNAYKNLVKHTKKECDSNSLRMIMISLPEHVSMEKAEKWIQAGFKRQYKKLSCVWLTRTIPAMSSSSCFLSHEFKFVLNLQADTNLLDKIMSGQFSYFKFTSPVGSFSMTESKQVLISDAGERDFSDYYCFQSGFICSEKTGKSFEGSFKYKPNIKCQVDLYGADKLPLGSVTPIFPPEFRTVLL